MDETTAADYYEALQISPNADSDTIQRVYRLLAQRFHPDNQATGNDVQFRLLHEAYLTLSDPEKRAQYDIRHQTAREERWRFVSNAPAPENDFEFEQHLRYTVMEILYSRRRVDPNKPGLSPLDLEQLTGQPREHLEFTLWYLTQKKMLTRTDNSSLAITCEGVDYLEQNSPTRLHRLRLTGERAPLRTAV
jgi:curved DNA-binding protein CbpA